MQCTRRQKPTVWWLCLTSLRPGLPAASALPTMLLQSKLWGTLLHPYKAAAVSLDVLGLSRQGASLAS